MFKNLCRSLRLIAITCLTLQATQSANAQSIGDNVVAYLNGALNTRVGGGRSFHMAFEALRIAGGEFVPSDLGNDYPSSGDRVWGTLVKSISCSNNNNWTDSAPEKSCQPGDIIQISAAKFASSSYPETFTVVVASVDANGAPNSIFQQNFNNAKVVKLAAIDITELTDGWLRIYRPIQRIDRFNTWKFTVVNNSSSNQTYQMMFGVGVQETVTLSPATNADSYYIHAVTTDGTVPNFLLSNQTSFFVETPKGNEIYDAPGGLDIRQLQK